MNKGKSKRIDFKVFSRGQLTAFISLMVICLVLASAIPILLSSNMLFSLKTSKDYKANELSDEDLISPISFSYIDEEATEKKREEEANKINPYFTYSYASTLTMSTKADIIYNYLVNGKEITDDSLLSIYDVLSEISSDKDKCVKEAAIIRETIDYFISEGIFSINDITYLLQEGKNEIYVNQSKEFPYTLSGKTLSLNDLIVDNSLSSYINQFLVQNYPNYDFLDLKIITDIVENVLEANIFYDEVFTSNMVTNARLSVEPVVCTVEKGDYILKIDTLVTPEQIHTLEVLNSKRVTGMSFFSALPRFLLILFVLAIWFYFSVGLIPYDYRKAQYSIISLAIFAVSLLVGFVCAWRIISYGFYNFDSIMPFLLVGMIGVSITNNFSYGLANIIALASMYTLWPNSTFASLFYYVLCGFIVNYYIMRNNGRFQTIATCFKCILFTVLITLFFSFLNNLSLTENIFSCLAMAVNVVLAFIQYAVLLPILEHIFNIPTKQRLNELAYTDNAILNQLSQVAQGTYNHVKNVSDLAYAGAKAIGANAELALVGARYHDIGKMVHPEYFVENQSDKNAHDSISTQLSRSIIKSHVRLGTEKGKEIGLPQEVLDIIGEHHGNDIIRFFYNEAVKNAGEKDVVVKEDFMYDGNIPSTKESAIVMLSDCVEAATRTIKRPNHQKYEKFITSIFSDKIAHGQLDNSGLTLTDLKILKQAFIPPLLGRDHHRISYDNDKE
mgnify:FL=1